MQDEPRWDGIVSRPVNISTLAYELVKHTWSKTGIWNTNWGVLPGMSWKHEQLVEVMLRDEMGEEAPPGQEVFGAGPFQTKEAPSKKGSPVCRSRRARTSAQRSIAKTESSEAPTQLKRQTGNRQDNGDSVWVRRSPR